MATSEQEWDEINVDGLLHEARCRAGHADRDVEDMQVMRLLFQALLRHSQRQYLRMADTADAKFLREIITARVLCEQDHPGDCDRVVLPPCQLPAVYRIPDYMYRERTGNPAMDAMIGRCVDVGHLVGAGPLPLWVSYLNITRRVLDAAAPPVHPTK